jgi:hypothetical protein
MHLLFSTAIGIFIGGAFGILTGNDIGLYMGKYKKAIEERLAKELRNHDAEPKKLPDNTIPVDLKSECVVRQGNSQTRRTHH